MPTSPRVKIKKKQQTLSTQDCVIQWERAYLRHFAWAAGSQGCFSVRNNAIITQPWGTEQCCNSARQVNQIPIARITQPGFAGREFLQNRLTGSKYTRPKSVNRASSKLEATERGPKKKRLLLRHLLELSFSSLGVVTRSPVVRRVALVASYRIQA